MDVGSTPTISTSSPEKTHELIFLPIYRTPPKPQQSKFKTNEQIAAAQMRVIDEQGTNHGVLTRDQALALAKEQHLDLVQLTFDETPVVRLINFGKFKYQQDKQAREKGTKEKKSDSKAVLITLVSQLHDLETRARQAETFLEQAQHVQIDLVMRGRQKAHADIAHQKMKQFLAMIKTPIKVVREGPFPRGIQTFITKV